VELPPEQQRRYLFNAYREFVERSARLTPLCDPRLKELRKKSG
jgi:hypothetical protein